MSKGKTRFNCAHKGYGSFCHRCKAADDKEAAIGTMSKEEAVAAKAEVAHLRSVPIKQYSSKLSPEALGQTESKKE